MKIGKMMAIGFVGIFGFATVAGYLLLFTPVGSTLAVRKGMSVYMTDELLELDDMEGNIADGIELKNFRLTNLKGFPEGTVVDIQRLFARLTSLNRDGWEVEVENARIKLPTSDPVVINGRLRKGQVEGNVYSRSVSLRDLLPLFPGIPRETSGALAVVDIYFSGPLTAPSVTGSAMVDTLNVKGFTLKEVPVLLNLTLKRGDPRGFLFGTLQTDAGTLLSKRTTVELGESRLLFAGNVRNPQLFLQGDCVVEKVNIHIAVRGTRQVPELTLTSDSLLPQDALLLMVATGKSWQGVQKSVDQQVVSTELAQDFIDYFLFDGRGQKLAEKFGITDIAVSFDARQKGVEVKKEIADGLQVDYGIEQTTDEKQNSRIKQKVGGEYQVTEKVSVGAEKEIVPQSTTAVTDPATTATPPPTDERVYFKYKTEF